jgi:hypothetical protein
MCPSVILFAFSYERRVEHDNEQDFKTYIYSYLTLLDTPLEDPPKSKTLIYAFFMFWRTGLNEKWYSPKTRDLKLL